MHRGSAHISNTAAFETTCLICILSRLKFYTDEENPQTVSGKIIEEVSEESV